MDKSLFALCNAVKLITQQLKSQNNALSFLLLIGKDKQGKKSLLQQSNLKQYTVDTERSTEIFYNHKGIIVNLGESWINESNCLLQQILKQLNRSHPSLKITGIIFCVDINDLFFSEHLQFMERCKAHIQFLHRFGQAVDYRLDLALILTKLDSLSGFCEFFQHSHSSELDKALGFSLYHQPTRAKLIQVYNKQYQRMVNILEQQVIHKMHPVRSSLRRTLIREFPLQMLSLQKSIQLVVQNIPATSFNLQALYFSSAEQGGYSQDRLNKKIKHEYALTIQDQFLQAKNYRAYFINGALNDFLQQTQIVLKSPLKKPKWLIGSFCGLFSLPLIWLIHHHVKTSSALDEASKELINYETQASNSPHQPPALFHLAKAAASLENLSTRGGLPALKTLKSQLQVNTHLHLHGNFLPAILSELEEALKNTSESPASRYRALKIYLMLNQTQHFSLNEVLNWYQEKWQKEPQLTLKKKLALLQQLLKQPLQPITINQQLVIDSRNYLNALPDNYLYYSLAKAHFPQEKIPLVIHGFELAQKEIPSYFTKQGFAVVISQLSKIEAQLQSEQWVLHRSQEDIQTAVKHAYCYEYVSWWKNLLNRSVPLHFQDYQQAEGLIQILNQSDAMNSLLNLVQQNTSPVFSHQDSLFNEEIASQFASLNLLGKSSFKELSTNIGDLENFLKTLSVVKDNGRTAFTLTKAQFQGQILPNPLNALYARSEQFPHPINNWLKQIADDAWYILMQETRNYINHQWKQEVFNIYSQKIANLFPFASAEEEINIADFEHFFATNGVLNNFLAHYLKPYLDMSNPQWQPKAFNQYVMPISEEFISELMRANVITNMFFASGGNQSRIDFSLQKITLDPLLAKLELNIGNQQLRDDQNSDSFARFSWPASNNARLVLHSIEGTNFKLEETGQWALFKLLQKVNVLMDEHNSANLQILFEINGNSGRYLLKTANKVNPFTPGILNGFNLVEKIV